MKLSNNKQQIINAIIAVYFAQEILFVAFTEVPVTKDIILYAIGLGWCLSAIVYLSFLEVKEALFQMMKQLNKEIMDHNKELATRNKP